MSVSNILAEINTARKRIEGVSNEQYRIALMYQYLTGVEKIQVAEDHRPIGNDVRKEEIPLFDSTIEVVIFKIKRIKKHIGKIGYCVLPLDDSLDEWVNIVYSYMQQYDTEPPFSFHENLETSGYYYMEEVKKTFEGLSFITPSYSHHTKGKIPAHPVAVTSKHLKEYRSRELIFKHNINLIELALFGFWDERSKFFKTEILEIINEDLSTLNNSEIVDRAIPYVIKLLKKNEVDDAYDYLLTQVECYFLIFCYNEICEGNVKEEVISKISSLLGKTEETVEQLLSYVAYFDPVPLDNRPFPPIKSESKLLGEMFRWFWNDKDGARNKLETYLKMVNSAQSLSFNHDLSEVRKKAEKYYAEEGSIRIAKLRLKRRSQVLVEHAREQFRNDDFENKLRCHACGFVKHESINNEIVHIHHKIQLRDLDDQGIKRSYDEITQHVIPLCPTCHSIAHSQKEPLPVDEIIKLLQHR